MTSGLPLSLWALHRFTDRPTPWRALAVSLAVAFAGLSCGYYGFFSALAVGLGMAYYAVSRRHWRRPAYWGLCLLAGVGAALAILPFFIPYLDLVRHAEPFRTLDDARQYSATWRSYLSSTAHLHRLVIGLVLPFNQADFPERVLFPGFFACGLAGAAVVMALSAPPGDAPSHPECTAGRAPRRETVGFYVLLSAVAAWFSLGPNGWLYTAAYHLVPGWSAASRTVAVRDRRDAGLHGPGGPGPRFLAPGVEAQPVAHAPRRPRRRGRCGCRPVGHPGRAEGASRLPDAGQPAAWRRRVTSVLLPADRLPSPLDLHAVFDRSLASRS